MTHAPVRPRSVRMYHHAKIQQPNCPSRSAGGSTASGSNWVISVGMANCDFAGGPSCHVIAASSDASMEASSALTAMAARTVTASALTVRWRKIEVGGKAMPYCLRTSAMIRTAVSESPPRSSKKSLSR